MRSVILLLSFLASALAIAQDPQGFYHEKERGWHWYEDPPPPKKPQPLKPKVEPSPQPAPEPPKKEAPPMFGAQWLRENLPKLRDDAIDHPDDPDKVAAYMYAQRVLLDKAQRFATAGTTMAKMDPLLDESNRVPMDTAAIVALRHTQERDKTEAIKHLAGVGGLLFFFDSTCNFCEVQQKALHWMAKDYGYTVRNISVDGKPLAGMTDWRKDDGLSRVLGLSVMPTTIFAVPPDKFYVISQGYHSAETLANKIMLVAMTEKLLPENLAASQKYFERGVLTPDDLRAQGVNPDDTKQWVQMLRKGLGAQLSK